MPPTSPVTTEQTTIDMPRVELSEADLEWVTEAIGEGYTKKQLAKQYGVSVPTLNRLLKGESIICGKCKMLGPLAPCDECGLKLI